MARLRARSRTARLAPRLVFAGIAVASIACGVAAGCGIDYEGSLVRDVGLDASENVGANVPEASADALSDGPSSDAGDAGVDGDAAPALSCSDTRCVDAGGECNPANTVCAFHCDGGSNCDAGLTCPPGVACHVTCAADNVCKGLIDCSQASSCDISCLGAHTCDGIECAGTSCKVACTGMDSCSVGAIHCEASDSCSVKCAGPGAMVCKDGVTAAAPDASIVCDDKACVGGATCYADYCQLTCNPIVGGGMAGDPGNCATKLCCDAGTCIIDGGGNTCPQ